MKYPNGTTTAPRVSSPYGPRKGGVSSFHYGTDYIGFDNIHAIAKGVVSYSGWLNSAAGNTIRIDHGNGIASRYMHNAKLIVRAGERVSEGQVIGVMGATGNATGKCCHLEIYVGSKAVDPVPYLKTHVNTENSSGNTRGAFPARERYGHGWALFLQDLLIILGHDTGGRDGKDGSKTQAAVRHEQGAAKRNGYGNLTQDGIGGVATVTYLLWAIAKYRSKGERVAGQPARSLYGLVWVKLIQRMLVKLGHNLNIDGKDGSKTQAAVRHEQGAAKRNGYGNLTQDGIGGVKTSAYLIWAITKYRLPWV